MTYARKRGWIDFDQLADQYKPPTNRQNVTLQTRAPMFGKDIFCPHCAGRLTVFNFAWSALECKPCGRMIEKTDWQTIGA